MSTRSLASVLGLAVLALAPLPAQAYVRDVTTSGVPIAWRYPCLSMQVYLGSPPPVLTAGVLLAASTQAGAAWSYPTIACTDIRIAMVASEQFFGDIRYDNNNVIVFRKDTWCRQPSPVDNAGVAQDDCYSPSALAITTIFKKKSTGEILDADIELNAVNYSWGDLLAQPDLAIATTFDLRSALTHELGHVIGLDHNCFTAGSGSPRLVDNTGAPAADCYSNPSPNVTEAMMYPSVSQTNSVRRVLSADDVRGACDIYPHQNDVCPAPPLDAGGAVVSTPDGGNSDVAAPPTSDPGKGGVAASRKSSGGCRVLAASAPGHSSTAMFWAVIGIALAALVFGRRRPKR